MRWLIVLRGRQHGSAVLHEWCDIFDLDPESPEDIAECMRRGALLMHMAQMAKAEVSTLPHEMAPDIMLASFGQVEQCLNMFSGLMGRNVAQFLEPLKDTGWQSLEMMDAVLARRSTQVVVEQDQVRDYLSQVRDLIDAVLSDDDLDADLKRYIIERLREVERAIQDALITGAPDLERAVTTLLGSVQRRPDMWDRIGKSKYGRRIAGVYAAICMGLSAVGGFPALMPGDEPPIIEQTTIVNVEQQTMVQADPDSDVVDGEIVDEAAGSSEQN